MSVAFPNTGETFADKYLIHSVLGSGGFARVYRALQVDLDRDVALKILRPPMDDAMSTQDRLQYLERLTARFQQEARVVSRLKCPNTITMYDYGRTPGGLLYMVLEFINGDTLSDILGPEKPVEQRRVARIVRQVLMSLHEAHAMDLLHRDIKPANIMIYEHLGEVDQIKLLDFGIAKLVGESKGQQKDLTSDGKIIGTPRYMSPEQIRGGALGPPSDIYSLGLVAYELLTGYQAIADNSSLQIITKQISPENFQLPETLPLHPQMREIINRMLSKNPAERYDTAQAVMAALAAINFDAPGGITGPNLAVLAVNPGTNPQVPNPYGPPTGQFDGAEAATEGGRSLVLPIALVALAVIAIGALVFVLMQGDAPQEPAPPMQAEVVPPVAVAPVPAAPPMPVAPPPAPEPPKDEKAPVLTIRSEPAGARVLVNGAIVGSTPLPLDTALHAFPLKVVVTRGSQSLERTLDGLSPDAIFIFDSEVAPETPPPGTGASATPKPRTGGATRKSGGATAGAETKPKVEESTKPKRTDLYMPVE